MAELSITLESPFTPKWTVQERLPNGGLRLHALELFAAIQDYVSTSPEFSVRELADLFGERDKYGEKVTAAGVVIHDLIETSDKSGHGYSGIPIPNDIDRFPTIHFATVATAIPAGTTFSTFIRFHPKVRIELQEKLLLAFRAMGRWGKNRHFGHGLCTIAIVSGQLDSTASTTHGEQSGEPEPPMPLDSES